MNVLLQIILGVLIGLIIVKSFKMPGARKMQAIMFLGKFYTCISNVEGKKLDKKTWDLVDLKDGKKGRRINIYFFLWPLLTTYRYPITYTKAIKKGQEKKGDSILFENTKTGDCVISRTNISDHVEFRKAYPTITKNLDTQELATVDLYTSNILEVVNPKKMLLEIDNYLGTAMELINGVLKGLVAEKKMVELNQFSSDEKEREKFDNAMNAINQSEAGRFCLPDAGMKLARSVYKDFDPSDEKAKQLMESYSDVVIAEQKGKATLAEQKGKTEAYKLRTDMEISQEKKKRIETGQAKEIDGKIVELIPEANTKVVAENIGKLSQTKGTVVIDSGGMNKMLNINPTKDEGGTE
ncbi:hypothetical protein KKA39_02240 [Patescibacteria group bacterium]|nr:hypothetical protein [Patescibacteria group bacterium]MBU1728104.1 hypothetical protein [Patescibacteria group bacterium]